MRRSSASPAISAPAAARPTERPPTPGRRPNRRRPRPRRPKRPPRSPTIESDTYEPFRGLVVGDRPASPGDFYQTPHVWVWNLTGEPTTISVAVATSGTELRRVESEFPAGAPLAVVFRERRTYDVSVSVGDRVASVTVEPDRFWCNATGTDVQVRSDAIETGTVSTSMACTTTASESA
ncbi:hypothetical protein M0R88_03745 [Halorussus gelatinilyticus]|uniref:Uncharacterized protein n=1 Tax=Halorussus gelatinilyticus TaxID=2937524 RepID=A0A8U0ILY2_9EURY|nr:hypothetical protein [Halorussus gelatinilyticus]UPW01224.1 hypothetical protein M0R88_03745 [Halorussus gelatinilyticus]